MGSLKKAIIEMAVNKSLRDIQADPKRGIQGLMELGSYFARGRSEKDVLNTLHEVLANLDSSFYQIVYDFVSNVDHNIITTFGINIGYNSLTEGVKRIRQHEKDNGYNVPWAIIFDFKEETPYKLSDEQFLDVIDQGKEIGVYSYIFFARDEINELIDILAKNRDCAFILFVHPRAILKENVNKIKMLGNTVISVLFDEKDGAEDFSRAVRLLIEDKCLFAIHSYYDDQNADEILSDQWIKQVQGFNCTFAFLIEAKECGIEIADKIHSYVKNGRKVDNYPPFLMDFYEDIAYIDRIISMESCLLTIRQDGEVSFPKEGQIKFNIGDMLLVEILSKVGKG